MKTKLVHPLWTHLPAIAALVVLVVYIINASPLPVRAPVHFGFNGEPNAYGSPWSVFGLIIGLSVFFILLSVFLDELWARQEKAKTFNWLSLFDDIVVGAMAGINIGYLVFLRHSDGSFIFPWNYLGLLGGSSIILAVILEMTRPYRLYSGKLVAQESQDLKTELVRRIKENSSFIYWDYQNPPYVTILTTVLPFVLLVGAVLSWFSQTWAFLVLVIVAILLTIPYGGQRTLVTRQNVTIRFGILGIKVLQLKMEDITGVETHEFAPLRDFGGYGIRPNREMTAYFLHGTRGVKITSMNGKKYLIGSDNADSLAMVISSVSQGISQQQAKKTAI